MDKNTLINEKIREYLHTCPHCKGKMNDFFCGNFRGRYLNKRMNTFKPRYFCTEECYEDYKKDFVIEIYNENPIYCVEINGEKRYIPYFESDYYFTNIDDCKKRMDMTGVAVVNMSRYGLFGI